ncbi:MAG: hypoxanthine phosphoribosyltransferase [candidate division Zixibacteria bacterium]|nr:hypoxanthine phosphoribosyltransferase [candidate division Zixibacteria bacterium]
MGTHKFELLFTQDKIARRIKEIGKQLSQDYADKDPILVGVLKGSIIFLADLIRNISIPIELEFISASSYNGSLEAETNVTMAGGPKGSIKGRHILLIEGIVDSGQTIQAIIDHLKLQEPASIEVVTLLDKPSCRKMDVDIKYKGFDAGENFVIGFGLDAAQKYRNLPFIGKVIK